MSMRSKALENIRAVMEREENIYRRENGYEESTWEHFRREAPKPKKEGNFLAGRFLGIEPSEPVARPEPVPEPEELEPEAFAEPEPEPEPQSTAQLNEPDIREVIPLKEGRHSWLYNEVVKAINDAARENSGTKIIAVFIPVVQNGKEFEELPVDASVEIAPVSMEDVRLEDLADIAAEPADHVDDIIPATHVVPDPELVEAFQTMEDKLDESIAEAAEEPELGDDAPEAMEFVEETESPAQLLPLPDPAELDALPEIDTDMTDMPEGDTLTFIEEDEESKGEPMIFVEQPSDEEESEEESKGEPMAFEDIASPESLPMPDALDDDEIEIQEDDKLSL